MKKICFIITITVLFGAVLFFVPWTCAAATISYTYDDAGRLVKASYEEGKSILYTYDANGNLLQVKVSEDGQAQLVMLQGWNLLALRLEPGDNSIDTLFTGIISNVTSIWKWDLSGESPVWAVYLPDDQDGDYAKSKGFNQLSELNPGEGFWVNAKQNQDIDLEGTPPSEVSISLVSGWNLTGLKSETGTTAANLISGKQGSITSIWKWDLSGESPVWAVYLPDDQDGDYAKSKGFNQLSELNPGEGFWVNAKQAAVLP
jgi:YD repeat-containing protein